MNTIWCGFTSAEAPWVSYSQENFIQAGVLSCDRCLKKESFILRLGANLSTEEAAIKYLEEHKKCQAVGLKVE